MQQLLLLASSAEHRSFSKPRGFIQPNSLCIPQSPNLHHVFGGLLSFGLQSCTLHVVWGCSLDVTQKSRRRILCIPKERTLMKCNLPLISSHYKFQEFYSSTDVIYSKSLNSWGWHSAGLEECCTDVRKVQIKVGHIKLILIYFFWCLQSWLPFQFLPQAPQPITYND